MTTTQATVNEVSVLRHSIAQLTAITDLAEHATAHDSPINTEVIRVAIDRIAQQATAALTPT